VNTNIPDPCGARRSRRRKKKKKMDLINLDGEVLFVSASMYFPF